MLIYMITTPSGKKYIGQTTVSFSKRMNAHKNASIRDDDERQCWALNRAIRKYGWENIKKEVVVHCIDIDELNQMEIDMIEEENTLIPNGYNIARGGAGCVVEQTFEIKEKRSITLRQSEITKNLPMYVKYRKTKYSEGYIVEKPGCKSVQFCQPNLSMEEKKTMALQALDEINTNDSYSVDLRRTYDFDLPQYVSYVKRSDGFRVIKPGSPTKYFCAKHETRETKLERALKYLNQL